MTQETVLTFEEAAALLRRYRQTILHEADEPGLARRSAKAARQDVGLTETGVLIVTGSNDWRDYLFYNLRPNRSVPPMPELDRLVTPDLPLRAYHQGFLLHAARVLAFLGDDRPTFIIGHSLGAATAQILGTVLDVPTIAFAAPQPVRRRFLKAAPLRDRAHVQWNTFNIAWRQDFVTRGFRLLGFRCLGHRKVLDLDHNNLGIDHFMDDYARLLRADAARGEARVVPDRWRTALDLPDRLA